jgi:hypothetical protein
MTQGGVRQFERLQRVENGLSASGRQCSELDICLTIRLA